MFISDPAKSQKGIVHLGIIAVILGSIIISTLLVQERTNFNPKAQDCEESCGGDDEGGDEDNGGDEESEPEQEPEPESEPEPEPQQEPEQEPEPQQPEPEREPEPQAESEPEGEGPQPEQPITEEPQPEAEIPQGGTPPEDKLIYEEELPVGETPVEEPGIWENLVEGVSGWVEDVSNGAGQLGEDLGVIDSEERMEDEVFAEAKKEEVPDPIEVIADESIPEADRLEAIRILAESNGVDPNDPGAVEQLLAALKTTETPAEDLALVDTEPVEIGPATLLLGREISADEAAAYAESANRILTQMFGSERSEGLDYEKEIIAYGLANGMSEEEITSKLYENHDIFFNDIKNYIKQTENGVFYVDLSERERPTYMNVLWSIVAKNNGVNDYGGFTGYSEQEVLDRMEAPFRQAMLTQAVTSKDMDYFTGVTRERLQRMIDYSVGNLPLPENSRDKYNHVNNTVQEGRTIVLNQRLFAAAYYGADKIPEDLGNAKSSSMFGLAPGGEGTIVLTYEKGAYDQITHDHEWIHQSAFSANPKYHEELVQQFGGATEDAVLANMLIEGTTETAAVLASHLDSSDPSFIAYRETVDDIRGAMIAEITKNGYNLDLAYATVARAALTGDYGFFFRAIGNHKDSYSPGAPSPDITQKGIDRVKEILKAEYLNKGSKATQGKGVSYLPIIDFLLPSRVFAQEGWNILNEDTQQIPAVSSWDQGFALGQALTQADKPLVSPLGTNSTSQVVIVDHIKNQQPVVVSNKLFELDSKVNITSNMNTQYGELGEEYTRSVLSSSLLNPQIVKQGSSYRLQTGRIGAVRGPIDKKTYRVKVRPMRGYNLSLPGTINSAKNSVLAIGVTPGRGRVQYVKPKTGFKINQLFTAFASEGSLTAAFYNDKNANGKWDRSENALPWAGASLELIGQAAATPARSTFTIDDIPFFKIQLGPQQ